MKRLLIALILLLPMAYAPQTFEDFFDNQSFIDEINNLEISNSAAQISGANTTGNLTSIEISAPSNHLITFTYNTSNATEVQPDDFTTGLWHFNGTTAEASGNGSTASLQNGATFSTGLYGQGLYLDGINDWVETNTGTIATSGTVELWFKPNVNLPISGGVVNRYIFSRIDARPNAFMVPDGRIVFNLYTGSHQYAFSTTNSWQEGRWYHLAFTWAPGTMSTYVDGTKQATTTYSGSMDTLAGTWRLGLSFSTAQPPNATIDDFVLYNYPRTAQEILDAARRDNISISILNSSDNSTIISDTSNGTDLTYLAGTTIRLFAGLFKVGTKFLDEWKITSIENISTRGTSGFVSVSPRKPFIDEIVTCENSTDFGENLTYRWFINSIEQLDENSSTLDLTGLASIGDIIQCSITSASVSERFSPETEIGACNVNIKCSTSQCNKRRDFTISISPKSGAQTIAHSTFKRVCYAS
ncbi:MAG: LamG domain-containing protein [DPANN group archaeon]|nr:LamG domain-containing protein [DPANN group archaeon]